MSWRDLLIVISIILMTLFVSICLGIYSEQGKL